MIRQFRIIGIVSLSVCSVLQAIISPISVNLSCVGIVLCGCIFVAQFALKESAFYIYPLSSLQVLAFTISNLFIPLVGTTLEWKPLIYNLKLPYQSIGFSALMAITLALAHFFYRQFKTLGQVRTVLAYKVVGPLGFFSPPTTVQIWAIGGVGLAASGVLAFVYGTEEVSVSNIIPQIMRGFVPFSYAPFLLPFAYLFWNTSKPTKLTWIAFSIYFAGVAGISLGLNARGAFAIPLATMIGCVFLAMLMGRLNINLLRPRFYVPALVILLATAYVLGDIATAMRIARIDRGRLSSTALALRSLEVFWDKEALKRYRLGQSSGYLRAGQYEERYLDNEFLQRLTFLKYADNTLYFVSAFGSADKAKLAEFSRNRILALLPAPALRFFGAHFNKWSVTQMSFGDFVSNRRIDYGYAIFRTGSIIGTGMALHGWWFFPILGLVAVGVFLFVDSFTLPPHRRPNGTWMGVLVAPVLLMFLFIFAFMFNQEALSALIGGFLRTIPQTLVLYLILFHGSRVVNFLHIRRELRSPFTPIRS